MPVVEPNPKRDLGEILMMIAAGVGLVWWASRGKTAEAQGNVPRVEVSYQMKPISDGFRIEWSVNNPTTQPVSLTLETWLDGVRKASTNIFIPPGEGRDVWQDIEASIGAHVVRLQVIASGKVVWSHEFTLTVGLRTY